ncbi:peptidyl-prolyl cis-trans isomerase SurA [Pseudarcicella hirudinis]|uniref:Peptidyl-prolyl cis-trans isomerase SurA n=1 Tax=Pseudarcicella hirudinis TaxID=1079859 RepID=A0A1I5RMM8_9BACT|nr:peptidylprolyl isomerase [Pseudarcicella hirudinis]SFP59511.1 peptidyl-prolyl cis-trans isomerase SurA [Pseudarcicella hirudinis]
MLKVIVKLVLFTVFLIASVFQIKAQTEPFAVKIGNRAISSEELSQSYRKLVQSDSVNKNNQKDFLTNFVNFKLKIFAAERAGKDTTLAFREELNTYKKELALPFLTDKATIDKLVAEAYERMREEVNVSQILIKVPKNASPADTMAAYDQIKTLRMRIIRGETFEQIAKENSQDTQTAGKGGNLGYISSLKYTYAFENACYLTPKGEVSMPFRTDAGYHLVKVNDRRTNRGKVRLAYILISAGPKATEAEKEAAKKKIDEAYKYLKEGESFEGVCRVYSDDVNSKSRGGELKRWYFASDLEDALADVVFNLRNNGDYSAPVQTVLGWHIFRLIDKKAFMKFEEMASFIRQKVLADPNRSGIAKSTLVKRLKKENNFIEFESVRQEALDNFTKDRSGNEEFLAKTLFTINQKPSTVKEFYNYVLAEQKKYQRISGSVPLYSSKDWYNLFAENQNINYEEQNLEVKRPDFKDQIQEYREGILYLNVMEDNVIAKSLDSLNQYKYFKEHSGEYQYTNRILAKVITSDRKPTLEQAKLVLAKSPYPLNRRFPDVHFPKDDAGISEETKKALYELVVVMTKNIDYSVEISGHSDADEKSNISADRARNIVNYLINKGIQATRIIEKDEGNYKNASKTDKTKNQRVSVKFMSDSMEDVVKRFNAIKPGSLTAEEKFFKKGENEYTDEATWAIGQQSFDHKGRSVWIDVRKVEEARAKTFTEARGTVINDMQKNLEANWINQLRQQYPVQINEEEVRKIIN